MLIHHLLFRDSDYAKQVTEAFKAAEKKHPKRVGSVTAQNSKLIEEQLLPMLIVQDRSTGEIVAQVINFVDHFNNKGGIIPESKWDTYRMYYRCGKTSQDQGSH